LGAGGPFSGSVFIGSHDIAGEPCSINMIKSAAIFAETEGHANIAVELQVTILTMILNNI
jgi:hypothetical protein